LGENSFSHPEIASKKYTVHFYFGNWGKVLPPPKLPIHSGKFDNEKKHYGGSIPLFWLDSPLNLPFLFFAVET